MDVRNDENLTPIELAVINYANNPQNSSRLEVIYGLCKYGSDISSTNSLSCFSTPLSCLLYGNRKTDEILKQSADSATLDEGRLKPTEHEPMTFLSKHSIHQQSASADPETYTE